MLMSLQIQGALGPTLTLLTMTCADGKFANMRQETVEMLLRLQADGAFPIQSIGTLGTRTIANWGATLRHFFYLLFYHCKSGIHSLILSEYLRILIEYGLEHGQVDIILLRPNCRNM
jgi:hypothetical protein